VTPLYYAASHGRIEALRFLIEKGAKVNVQDTFYKASALNFTLQNGHLDAAALLIEKGAAVDGNALQGPIFGGKLEAVKMLLARAKFKPEELSQALSLAEQQKKPEIADALKAAGAKPEARPDVKIPAAVLASYAGLYKGDELDLRIEVREGKLFAVPSGQPAMEFFPLDERTFQFASMAAIKIAFQVENAKPTAIVLTQGARTLTLKRVED
jgi:hypothetical protein